MDDEMMNNLVAAGGLWIALGQAGLVAEPVMVDGNATNSLVVRFHFLKSPYRVTVERIDEDDHADGSIAPASMDDGRPPASSSPPPTGPSSTPPSTRSSPTRPPDEPPTTGQPRNSTRTAAAPPPRSRGSWPLPSSSGAITSRAGRQDR